MPTTLAVKIDRSLHNGGNLYGAVSGFWKLNMEKAQKLTTIVAISKQKVVGVFSVSIPFLVTKGKDKGRIGFRSVSEQPSSSWQPFLKMQPFDFKSAIKYL